MKRLISILALSLLTVCAFAQQAQPSDEAKEEKELREAIDKQIDNYTEQLQLEDWQVFYLDSILTHDYTAMRDELKALSASKVSNGDAYQRVQDKWNEQIYQSNQKVMDETQWTKYLKMGAARDKKARDKREEKRK